jgi:hypothetical protein
MRRFAAALAVGAVISVLAGVALAAAEKKKPDATLKLTEGSVAVGIGWSWGKGELTYKGKTYKFKVDGVTAGEVGKTKVEATGEVFNLKKIEDFDGVYAAGSIEGTGGTGAGVTALSNPKGVSILLKSTTEGANLKAAVEGVNFKIEK